jgi:hypothetical protein
VDQASALYRAAEDRLRRSSDPTALAAATPPRLQSPLPAVEPVSPPQPILPQASMNTAVIPAPAAAAPAPVTTASLPAAKSDAPADAAWQPPRADPSDPLQVRAEAVGLHPDLSRAVLARLSAEDFRNAGLAIKTALVETPDDGVHAWPRQRKPEQALFQVRFVPGAGPNCRRYVVVVTKDRWSTTALPMERCGTHVARAPAAAAAAATSAAPVRRDAARAEDARPSPVRRP